MREAGADTADARPSGQIRRGIEEVVWPVVPAAAGAGMLALQFQLDLSQWWDPDALAAQQYRQLHALLSHARRTSPFYEARLAGIDLDAPLTPAAFAALPILTRAEVQAEFDALRSRVIPADHGGLLEFASSGSTGRPVHVLGTHINQFWWKALVLRDHLWHGRDLGGKLGIIKTKVETGTVQGWGPATDGAFVTGPRCSINSRHDIAEQAQWLLREEPDYLLSHASNLRALARYCLAHGLRPQRLREVRSFGESLAEDMREVCRAAWDVPVKDVYTAQEIGYIALQCPTAEHYHVQAEHVLVEVLDEDGRACAPGASGRVVVTPLHNYAMPLIRYDLNDYVELGAPCACGRGLPVIARIRGRRRNMLRLPDGSTHWPSIPAYVWGSPTPVRQFQLLQTELACIVVRLVVERALTEDETRGIRERLSARLGWPFEYRFEYVAHIEGGPLFEDFMCLIEREQ